jgi:hypothetical protein
MANLFLRMVCILEKAGGIGHPRQRRPSLHWMPVSIRRIPLRIWTESCERTLIWQSRMRIGKPVTQSMKRPTQGLLKNVKELGKNHITQIQWRMQYNRLTSRIGGDVVTKRRYDNSKFSGMFQRSRCPRKTYDCCAHILHNLSRYLRKELQGPNLRCYWPQQLRNPLQRIRLCVSATTGMAQELVLAAHIGSEEDVKMRRRHLYHAEAALSMRIGGSATGHRRKSETSMYIVVLAQWEKRSVYRWAGPSIDRPPVYEWAGFTNRPDSG